VCELLRMFSTELRSPARTMYLGHVRANQGCILLFIIRVGDRNKSNFDCRREESRLFNEETCPVKKAQLN